MDYMSEVEKGANVTVTVERADGEKVTLHAVAP
jgi:copper(I)-binding protein